MLSAGMVSLESSERRLSPQNSLRSMVVTFQTTYATVILTVCEQGWFWSLGSWPLKYW